MMKEENMNIKRGDIFYVFPNGVPAVGSEQRPGRPGVIVSSDSLNRGHSVVEVVYTTTKPKGAYPTHTAIMSTPYESTVLCEQITAVSVDRLGEKCGKVTDEEMERIDSCLKSSLGLLDIDKANLRLERDMYKNMYELAMKKLAEVSFARDNP